MVQPTFVIEHLEKQVWKWCEIEYSNAAKLIMPWKLMITNIDYDNSLGKNVKLEKASISEIGIDWNRICVLDPKATEELKPSDKTRFDYFVFGGILGDEEFNGRTGIELTSRLPKGIALRHLGDKQFSTDNALLVTKMILNGKELKEIPLQWQTEIEINNVESVILPYCYPLLDGKPQISPELIEYLKNKKGF